MKNIQLRITYDCPSCCGSGKIPAQQEPNSSTIKTYTLAYCPVCYGEGRLSKLVTIQELLTSKEVQRWLN